MDDPIRILIAEDSPEDAELVQHDLLRAGMRLEARVVETREAFTRALSAFDPQLVLCDNHLPRFDALAALRLTRERRPGIPFILVTGSIDDAQAARLLEAGATDYVLKDRRSRLASAVRRALKEAEERARRRRAEEAVRRSTEQIARSALFDSLTGLPNRRLLLDALAHALEGARSGGPGFALLQIDLDHFKEINESLGHEAGDGLLVAVAERLTRSAGAGETAARLGGDEFAVLARGPATPEEATDLAERLRRVLFAPVALGGGEVEVPVSVGLVLGPAGYARPEDLLRDADTALYRAKARGRACVEVFEPAMRERVQAFLRLQTELRQALEQGEFRLVFQPIVRLRAGGLAGCEALLRWDHPTRGRVSPAEFIPVAEESGAILPIGEWVMREACVRAREWSARVEEAPPVSVNLSARQFRDPGLARGVERVLTETGLPPARLKLEVTETAVIHDAEAAARVVRAIRGLGVGFALDDFGTGHSSLAYVKRFPLSDLKIDQSFVSEITCNAEAAAIVTAVVRLGRSLGVTVVAEGIESEAQRHFLRHVRCEAGQGFHLGRPVDAGSLEAILEAGRPPELPAGRGRPSATRVGTE